MKVKLKGKECDVEDAVGNAIKELGMDKKKMEDENDELADAIKDIIGDEAEDKKDSNDKDKSNDKFAILQAKFDAATDELNKYREIADKVDEDDNFKSKLKEHNKATMLAQKVLKKDELEKLDDMDLSEIKEAVIRADSKDVDSEKLKNDSYVNARFDLVAEKYAKADSVKEKIGKEIIENKDKRTDENENTPGDARAKSIRDANDRMKKRMDALSGEDE